MNYKAIDWPAVRVSYLSLNTLNIRAHTGQDQVMRRSATPIVLIVYFKRTITTQTDECEYSSDRSWRVPSSWHHLRPTYLGLTAEGWSLLTAT
jgi:hypothetical protein